MDFGAMGLCGRIESGLGVNCLLSVKVPMGRVQGFEIFTSNPMDLVFWQ